MSPETLVLLAYRNRDQRGAAKFGELTAGLRGRHLLSRFNAKVFVVVTFYRRYLIAFFIVWYENNPVAQVLSVYVVCFSYTSFIFANPVYIEGREEERRNELMILLILVTQMLFVEDYIGHKNTRDIVGVSVIIFILFNIFQSY